MAERERERHKSLKIAKAALLLLLPVPWPLQANQSSILSWQGALEPILAGVKEGAGRLSITESKSE